jgi:hypothetical protein
MLRAVAVWWPLAALLIGFVVLAWIGARAGRNDRHTGRTGLAVEHDYVRQLPADPLSSTPPPQPPVYKEERERAASSHQGSRGRYRQDDDDGEPGLGNTTSEEIVVNAATIILLIAAAFFGDYLERSQDGTEAIQGERRSVFKTLRRAGGLD